MGLFQKTITSNNWFGKHQHGGLARASLWAAAQNGCLAVIQFVSVIVLSRLVAPEDFGRLAIVFVFYSLAAQLVSNGMTMASIQKEELTEQLATNAFWIVSGLSALMAIALAGLGPLLSWIYGDAQLTWIAVVLAFLLCLEGMFSQHMGLLRRNMRFDLLLYAGLGSAIPALAVAVWMAWAGFGVWALVGQLVIGGILTRLFIKWFVPWTPGPLRKGAGSRSMVRFGGLASFGTFVDFAYRRSQIIVLGHFGSLAEVGFFNRGQALFDRPFQQITYPISALMLPALSARQNDVARSLQFTQLSLWLMGLLILPLLIWLGSFSPWVVSVLLGSEWTPVAGVLEWLALGGVLLVFRRPLVNLNASLGRPARAVWLKLMLLVPMLLLTAWASGIGANVVAAVLYLVKFIALPFEFWLFFKGLDFPARPLLLQITYLSGILVILTFLLPILCGFFERHLSFQAEVYSLSLATLATLPVAYLLMAMLAMIFRPGREVFSLLANRIYLLRGRTKQAG